MAEKDNFQKEVVQTLLNSGFKDIFEQKEHKEFIQMIAATYFSSELTFDGIIEYLADIVDNEAQRKAIAEIIRDAKTPKVQKKPQPPKEDKQDKVEKKPQKKVKVDNPPKAKETKNEVKNQKSEEAKKEPEPNQGEQGNGVDKKGLKHELQKEGKVKCRFFPFCKNQETGCEFFHPTEKCQYFPHCRYGDNCLYVHEACRFKEKCTKLNCPYAHPGKRPSNPLEAFMKNMMMSKGANMFNKQKPQKKRPPQHDAKEEQQHEQ